MATGRFLLTHGERRELHIHTARFKSPHSKSNTPLEDIQVDGGRPRRVVWVLLRHQSLLKQINRDLIFHWLFQALLRRDELRERLEVLLGAG